MEMTFDQYIQNPMGRDNAVISNRTMYRNLYQVKLDAILVRELGKIEYHCYRLMSDGYYIYLKIPSEKIPKFYYDVIIEFRPPKRGFVSTTLKDYLVRFYSNDPSFVYTFAHAFIKNDMFIKQYTDKMSKEAVQKVAKEKNPTNQVGYVKSLYFAYLFMIKKGLFSKVRYLDIYDEKAVKREVMHASEKIKLRQEAASSVHKKHSVEKREDKELTNPRNNTNPEIPIKQGFITKTKVNTPIKKTTTTTNKIVRMTKRIKTK